MAFWLILTDSASLQGHVHFSLFWWLINFFFSLFGKVDCYTHITVLYVDHTSCTHFRSFCKESFCCFMSWKVLLLASMMALFCSIFSVTSCRTKQHSSSKYSIYLHADQKQVIKTLPPLKNLKDCYSVFQRTVFQNQTNEECLNTTASLWSSLAALRKPRKYLL